jgi:hypothetical protein
MQSDDPKWQIAVKASMGGTNYTFRFGYNKTIREQQALLTNPHFLLPIVRATHMVAVPDWCHFLQKKVLKLSLIYILKSFQFSPDRFSLKCSSDFFIRIGQ